MAKEKWFANPVLWFFSWTGVSIAVLILTMLFGWGLRARSWPWVILGYTFLQLSFAFTIYTRIRLLKFLGLEAREEPGRQMRVMDFKYGYHSRGWNTTVRRGTEWADLRVGDRIRLSTNGVLNEGLLSVASVKEVAVKRFLRITEGELELEHDPGCATIQGLHKVMKAAYPNFSTNDVCTVVTYQPVGSDGIAMYSAEPAERASGMPMMGYRDAVANPPRREEVGQEET